MEMIGDNSMRNNKKKILRNRAYHVRMVEITRGAEGYLH